MKTILQSTRGDLSREYTPMAHTCQGVWHHLRPEPNRVPDSAPLRQFRESGQGRVGHAHQGRTRVGAQHRRDG